jgi:Lon protease-like protein
MQVKRGVQSKPVARLFAAMEAVLSTLRALFPLDLVLLPNTPLPLHIFEDRYREMVAECLENKKAFGVVRAKENEGVADIGCTAEIVEVSKRYQDGRMDILTRGRERFEVMRVDQERAFLRAEVAYIQDEPGKARPEDISRALKLQGEILELAGAEIDRSAFEESPQLSFVIAGSLPLDLDFKQTLLGVNSESERMQTVIAYLETILPNLRRTLHLRQKAGGNGHGL